MLIVPENRRGAAQRALALAKLTATRRAAPGIAEIEARYRKQILDMALAAAEPDEAERAFVAELLGQVPPERIAAAFVREQFSARPVPEDLSPLPVGEMSAGKGKRDKRFDDARGPMPAREPRGPDMEGGVWFTISLGRKQRADPKWLLPMICKAGGVSKRECRLDQDRRHRDPLRDCRRQGGGFRQPDQAAGRHRARHRHRVGRRGRREAGETGVQAQPQVRPKAVQETAPQGQAGGTWPSRQAPSRQAWRQEAEAPDLTRALARLSAAQAWRFLAGALDISGIAAAIAAQPVRRQFQHAVRQSREKMPVLAQQNASALIGPTARFSLRTAVNLAPGTEKGHRCEAATLHPPAIRIPGPASVGRLSLRPP